MAESLNVIALISGGKDSFFSILHCMRHGHKVVALANLYPEVVPPQERAGAVEGMKEIEQDLNSFMYQTVGHTVIPLYEKALGIPLYRQQITGSAVQTHTSYSHAHISEKSSPKVGDKASEDETESLVPLLKRVMQEHPSANALSTGAILSTYQRTRVESVALRLGLTPLSYLWKYPILPPATQMSLLEDMRAVGMDARIVKVASGGLDESFLWENVASENAMRRIERVMGRFGVDGDGAVLGEGGEFETLVIDGPRCLFKERIEVPDGNWLVVREGGGSAWLKVFDARSVVKASESATQEDCRIPGLFEQRFEGILDVIQKYNLHDEREEENTEVVRSVLPYSFPLVPESRQGDVLYWTITAKGNIDQGISDEAEEIMAGLRHRLSHASIEAREIISATIVLRSMHDFQAVNQVYGALFTHPNPPSRVTISSGPAMPTGINIILHLKIANAALSRRGLHVQSRSYWAPANIGPYSQAISICQSHNTSWTVHIAGQIPLIPSTMQLLPPSPPSSPQDTFALQSILALQHLFRIAEETNIYWFTSAVAYLPHTPLSPSSLTISSRAIIAGHAWSLAHPFSSDSDEEEDSVPDLWEAKHHHHFSSHHSTHASKKREIPDRERISGSLSAPPFFAVEVHELPRSASVEWHAHIGVARDLSGEEGSSRVHVSMREKADDGWKMYDCRIGEGRVVSIFMLFYLHNSGILRLGDGVRQAGMEMQGVCACYVDVSESGSGKRIWEGEAGMVGMVPCRSIWDEEGRRITAVVIFDRDSM